MTYPIQGYPWRRNPSKHFEFRITPDVAFELFEEVAKLQRAHPDQCLADELLWSDHSEKANAITRDLANDTLCHTIAIYDHNWHATKHYYSMREDSEVLKACRLFNTIMSLIAPHEHLDTNRAQQISGGNGG